MLCHNCQVFGERRRLQWSLIVVAASLVALPVALAISGLVLPGDPDDPDTRAVLAAAILVVPAWTLAGLIGVLCARVVPRSAGGLRATFASATTLATSAWLLGFAWPIAAATPAPGTKEEAAAAQFNPHLWAPGAWRMALAAVLLAAGGLYLGRHRHGRSPGSAPAS